MKKTYEKNLLKKLSKKHIKKWQKTSRAFVYFHPVSYRREAGAWPAREEVPK